jgi:hypothetical protein
MSAAQLRAVPFGEVRFFCQTNQHDRVLHFKTSSSAVVSYFRGEGENALSLWTDPSTELLGNHTTSLPLSTNDLRFGPNEDENMTFFPFMQTNTAHWSLGAFTNRWECDDFRNGPEAATFHQIWIR